MPSRFGRLLKAQGAKPETKREKLLEITRRELHTREYPPTPEIVNDSGDVVRRGRVTAHAASADYNPTDAPPDPRPIEQVPPREDVAPVVVNDERRQQQADYLSWLRYSSGEPLSYGQRKAMGYITALGGNPAPPVRSTRQTFTPAAGHEYRPLEHYEHHGGLIEP